MSSLACLVNEARLKIVLPVGQLKVILHCDSEYFLYYLARYFVGIERKISVHTSSVPLVHETMHIFIQRHMFRISRDVFYIIKQLNFLDVWTIFS